MNYIKNIWKCFEEKHSAFAKWLYQIFYFVVFSMGVTVFQYLVFTFLPGIFGNLSGLCRIYVAKDFHESVWSKIYMESAGV